MMREDIIRMARDAGFGIAGDPEYVVANNYDGICDDELERFAALVAAAEREACAKVCEDDESKAWDWSGNTRVGNYFARVIRVRGNT
jgi:hypothetical protein